MLGCKSNPHTDCHLLLSHLFHAYTANLFQKILNLYFNHICIR